MREPLVNYSRDADPVDPNALSTAFGIIMEMPPRRRYRVPYTEENAAALWDEIQLGLGTAPRATSDLFRRAMALLNFFAEASRRRRFGVGAGMPEPEIWRTAAVAPVIQRIFNGHAYDSFDEADLAATLRGKRD